MNAFSLSCLKYSLGPILWWQGQRVRKRTPKLTEPVGDRIGQRGGGKQLRLLVLGDSSAAGVGVTDQQAGLLGQILLNLNNAYQINYELRARTGARTRDALADLKKALHQCWPSSVEFDVVVTALGVNDVTGQISVKKWCQQQQLLMETIHNKLKPKLVIISGLPPMHLFPALPTPLRHYLGAWADLFNDELKLLSKKFPQTSFLSVRDLPSPKDVASDGFHPGPVTYQQWGKAVVKIIQRSV